MLAAAAALAAAGVNTIGGAPDAFSGRQIVASGAKTSASNDVTRSQEQRRTSGEKAAFLRLRNTQRVPGYPRPGWSVRRGQRMARKARNRARHRKACR